MVSALGVRRPAPYGDDRRRQPRDLAQWASILRDSPSPSLLTLISRAPPGLARLSSVFGPRPALFVVLLAMGVRVSALLLAPAWELRNDDREYFTIARYVRFAGVFSMGGLRQFGPSRELRANEAPEPSAWRAPLFPGLIAALWWRAAEQPPIIGVQLALIAAGSATAGLAASISGTPAGVLVALWPLFVKTDIEPLSEPLFTFLLLLGLHCWLRRFHALAGISLGAATLTR